MTSAFHILADTSVLIDYVRSSQKHRTLLHKIFETATTPIIAVATEYEFCVGKNPQNVELIEALMKRLRVVPMNSEIVQIAVPLYLSLKRKNALIGVNDTYIAATALHYLTYIRSRIMAIVNDTYIAATALHYDIPLATLNTKHFSRLEQDFGLQILANI
ncbi:MAG: type II toxin-antitoxin system VapC family toxin [Candidatus Kapabacteria bacterium]|jgi:predicted nucleic acid-binding protein|nr:type II toxin-antitoxin system VapC family toxin [Candidatus Kapabacteria bacterium]